MADKTSVTEEEEQDLEQPLNVKVPGEENGRWYIIHTYSGQEERVKNNLTQRIESLDVRDRIFRCEIPTEEEIEIREGKRKQIQKKVFPGYLLVCMIMDTQTWQIVRNTPGVTGFVSVENERTGQLEPVPLEEAELEAIFKRIESPTPRVRVGFEIGQNVRITEGPFTDFIGTVNDISPDKGKVQVLVSFFGRETPVELDFRQVERV